MRKSTRLALLELEVKHANELRTIWVDRIKYLEENLQRVDRQVQLDRKEFVNSMEFAQYKADLAGFREKASTDLASQRTWMAGAVAIATVVSTTAASAITLLLSHLLGH